MRDKGFLRFLREEGRCRACAVECQRKYRDLTVESVHAALRVISTLCDPMHGPVNGMSSKGPDDGAIPGCRWHHEEQTAIGWPAYEKKYGFLREDEAKVWLAAYTIWKEHNG